MSLPVLAFTREECKSLYDAYMACNHDKPFVARAFGVCEESKFLLDKCLRAEVRLDMQTRTAAVASVAASGAFTGALCQRIARTKTNMEKGDRIAREAADRLRDKETGQGAG
jgi:hypothetical protein